MQYLSSVFNQSQHVVVADPVEPDGIGMEPGVPIIDPIHIREDLAFVCF